jgi:hypothetical protein
MAAKIFHAKVNHAWTTELFRQTDHQIGNAGRFRAAGTGIYRFSRLFLEAYIAHDCSFSSNSPNHQADSRKLSKELPPVNMPKYIGHPEII